jgi:hypothetical protein
LDELRITTAMQGKGKEWSRWITAVTAGLIVVLLLLWGPESVRALARILLLFVGGPWVLFLTATYAHEVGHLLVGSLLRFRCQEFVVGPLRLETEAGRLRLRSSGDLMGGRVKMVPQGVERIRPRLYAMVLGGPLTNLALAVPLLYGRFTVGELPLGSVWGFIHLFTGLMALVQTDGHLNDGQLLRRIRGNDRSSREYVASYVYVAEQVDEARRAEVLVQLGFPAWALDKELEKASSERDLPRARQVCLDAVNAVEDDGRRAYYRCLGAYYLALRGFDVDAATNLLPPEEEAAAHGWSESWFQGATMIALARSHWDEAVELADRALGLEAIQEETWFHFAGKVARRYVRDLPERDEPVTA